MPPKKKASRKTKPAVTKAAASLAAPGDYPQLLAALKSRIQIARVQAHLAVNRELIRLYWDLGRMIVERQKIEGWGKAVIERLSTDLRTAFPAMTGLSVSIRGQVLHRNISPDSPVGGTGRKIGSGKYRKPFAGRDQRPETRDQGVAAFCCQPERSGTGTKWR